MTIQQMTTQRVELENVGEVIHDPRYGDLKVVMVIKVPRGKLVLTSPVRWKPVDKQLKNVAKHCGMIRSFMQTYG